MIARAALADLRDILVIIANLIDFNSNRKFTNYYCYFQYYFVIIYVFCINTYNHTEKVLYKIHMLHCKYIALKGHLLTKTIIKISFVAISIVLFFFTTSSSIFNVYAQQSSECSSGTVQGGSGGSITTGNIGGGNVTCGSTNSTSTSPPASTNNPPNSPFH
jgi:hypothetical protein